MVRESEQVAEKDREKQVEALIIKNTSVAGMMLHRNTKHMLPLSLAMSLRDQGLAVPVKKAQPSHPVPPPKPKLDFDGENGEDEVEGPDEPKSDEKSRTSARSAQRQKEGGE